MKYKIGYTLKETKTVTIGSKGQMLKHPRRTQHWTELHEYISADGIEEALEKAQKLAKERGWIVDIITQMHI